MPDVPTLPTPPASCCHLAVLATPLICLAVQSHIFSICSSLAPLSPQALKSSSFLGCFVSIAFLSLHVYHFSSDFHHFRAGLLRLSLYNSFFCYSFVPLTHFISLKRSLLPYGILLLRNSTLLLINKPSLWHWSNMLGPSYLLYLWHCAFHLSQCVAHLFTLCKAYRAIFNQHWLIPSPLPGHLVPFLLPTHIQGSSSIFSYP